MIKFNHYKSLCLFTRRYQTSYCLLLHQIITITFITRKHSSRIRTVRFPSSSGRGVCPTPGPLDANPLTPIARPPPPGCRPPWSCDLWYILGSHPPPMNRITDRCKNITLSQTSFAGSNYNQNPAGFFGKLETVTPIAYIYVQYLYFCWNGTFFQQWPRYIIDVSKKLSVFYWLLAREISLIKVIINILLWDKRVARLSSWWYWYVLCQYENQRHFSFSRYMNVFLHLR